MKLENDILNDLLLEGYITEDQALDAYEKFVLNEEAILAKKELLFTANLAEEIIKMNDDELIYLINESMIPEFGVEKTNEILEDVTNLLEGLADPNSLLEASIHSIKKGARLQTGYRAGDAKKAQRALKQAYKNQTAQGGTDESKAAVAAAEKNVQLQNARRDATTRSAARLARASAIEGQDKKVSAAKKDYYGKYNWWQRHFSQEGRAAKAAYNKVKDERKLENKYGTGAQKKLSQDSNKASKKINSPVENQEPAQTEVKEKLPNPGPIVDNPGTGSKVEVEPAAAPQKPAETK